MRLPGQVIALGCLLLLNGCVGTLHSTFDNFRRTITPTAEIYRERALYHERQGELREALLAWRVTAQLDAENQRIPKIINTLERGMAKAVNVHFQEAMKSYENGDYANAQRELLIVLRLDPSHKKAKTYLKKELHGRELTHYKVQRGDSFTRIATRIYKDPTKAYIIAYYNELDPRNPLLIGTQLLLPSLDAKYLMPRADIETLATRAQRALNQKDYKTALSATSEILSKDPGHKQAGRLREEAYFGQAETLMDHGDYLGALERLKQVGPDYPGRSAVVERARKQIGKQNLTARMEVARQHLRSKAYESAVNVSEEIMVQYPGNPEVRELNNAAHYALGKQLLENNEDEAAVEALNAVEQPYEDTAQLISQGRGRLNARAETLYRKGVKHFLNEELEQAIAAWEKTLALNPKHPKAGQDIEDALKLLEKWRGLEKEQSH